MTALHCVSVSYKVSNYVCTEMKKRTGSDAWDLAVGETQWQSFLPTKKGEERKVATGGRRPTELEQTQP